MLKRFTGSILLLLAFVIPTLAAEENVCKAIPASGSNCSTVKT